MDEMLVANPEIGRASTQNFDEDAFSIQVQTNYRAFHDFWSSRAFFGDPTLRIVEKVVLEDKPFSEIEQDLGLSRHDRVAENAFVRGLRCYAALAEWVEPQRAMLWIEEAKQTFLLKRLAGRRVTPGRGPRARQ